MTSLAPVGAHSVTVTNGGGTSNAVTLTVRAPPSLSGQGFPVMVTRGSVTVRTFTYTNSTGASVTLGTSNLTAIQNTVNAFAITTDNCSGKTLAANGTCTIGVTLTARNSMSVYGANVNVPATTAGVPTATLAVASFNL